MRILVLLFKLVLILGVVAAAAFFISREALLLIASRQMVSELRELQQTGKTKDAFNRNCRVSTTAEAIPATVQSVELAFLNESQFQLQLLCSNFSYQPVAIRSGSLPRFVTKAPGSGGFVWSSEVPTSITLSIWGRSQTITLNNQDITVSSQGADQAVATSTLSPLTQCTGYGFQCCQDGSQVGAGEQAPNVLDCPRSCFSQCPARPVVLTFNTQPFYNSQTRVVNVMSGEVVTFSYVVELSGSDLQQVKLLLGDGQELTSLQTKDTLTHTFSCNQPLCTYQAKLTITDTAGMTNVDSNLNQVTISVSGG